jgi:hypothetical protein
MPVRACEKCGKGFVQGRGRPARRCPECQKYGGYHQQYRAENIDSAYGGPCTRCGSPLEPGQEIHLDHADGGGARDYAGFAHARCNESAGGRLAGRRQGTLSALDAPLPPPPSRPFTSPRPRDVEHHPDCPCIPGSAKPQGPWGHHPDCDCAALAAEYTHVSRCW